MVFFSPSLPNINRRQEARIFCLGFLLSYTCPQDLRRNMKINGFLQIEFKDTKIQDISLSFLNFRPALNQLLLFPPSLQGEMGMFNQLFNSYILKTPRMQCRGDFSLLVKDDSPKDCINWISDFQKTNPQKSNLKLFQFDFPYKLHRNNYNKQTIADTHFVFSQLLLINNTEQQQHSESLRIHLRYSPTNVHACQCQVHIWSTCSTEQVQRDLSEGCHLLVN